MLRFKMKNFDEIKDIIVNKLGIPDLPSYDKWLNQFKSPKTPDGRLITKEDIEILSPDVVNCYDFWKVIDEIFGLDPVCATDFGRLAYDIDSGNLRNLRLARLSGMLDFVDDYRHKRFNLLEIGPGYGSFKQYCLLNTNFTYYSFDVVCRIYGVNLLEVDGTLPRKFIEDCPEKFKIIYSSNVFQHLSSRQKSQYFQDIAKLLEKDGIFVFNCFTHSADPAKVSLEDRYSEDNRMYLKHYGQLTEIPYYYEFMDELEKHFRFIQETRRRDGFISFTLAKKVDEKPS
jgi:hypothetical protein